MFRSAKTALIGGLAAAAFAGAVATSTTAEAQVYYGSPYGYGSGYNQPVQYRQYRHHDRRAYRRRDNTGAAIAGLIGGLAVGALAAQAAQPRVIQRREYVPTTQYYGGGYPATGYYGGRGYYAQPQSCWIERRRLRTNSGKPLYEDRQVCR